MNKYVPFIAAILLTTAAMPAFAQGDSGLTGNALEDGSANPVNNSLSMGNTPGSAPLIKGNSPVVLVNKNANPTLPEDKAATGETTHHHHHHHHRVVQQAPVNANPMGAGR